MEVLPVFVYGTLRPGEPNWPLVAPHAAAVHPARLADHALYGAGWSFPYATTQHDAVVIGDLVDIRPDVYVEALADLDSLEGFRAGRRSNHYDRHAVTVRIDNGRSRRAWVYLAGSAAQERLTRAGRIPDGDWLSDRRQSA